MYMCRLTQVSRTDGIVEWTEKCHKFTHCHSIRIDYSPYTVAAARTRYIQPFHLGAFNRHPSVFIPLRVVTWTEIVAKPNLTQYWLVLEYSSRKNSSIKWWRTHAKRKEAEESSMKFTLIRSQVLNFRVMAWKSHKCSPTNISRESNFLTNSFFPVG